MCFKPSGTEFNSCEYSFIALDNALLKKNSPINSEQLYHNDMNPRSKDGPGRIRTYDQTDIISIPVGICF